MAWNGSGVFNRDYNWVNDRDASIDITASRMDAEFDNFATGIQACVAKNGENAATANLPMATFKHTNVGASAARTDYARVAEIVDGAHVAKDAGGTANAQTLTLSPAVTGYVKYQRFSFIPVADNTGACTLNVSALGAKNIKLLDGTDPAAKDLNALGVAEVAYDGTNFLLLNPATFTATAAATWANKTLISPVLTSPILNGALTGTAIDTDVTLAANSDTVVPSQKAVNTKIGGLNTKIINIGDWDMTASSYKLVAHGLDHTKIRSISAIIRKDDDSTYYDLDSGTIGTGSGTNGAYANNTDIILNRYPGGTYDNTNFDATGYNRGWITIQYID